MSGVLVIGEAERILIRIAVMTAFAKPIPLHLLETGGTLDSGSTVMLADRKTDIAEIRRQYPSQNVMLGSYRAAISFEQQPIGLTRHLSVSSAQPGKLPGPEVIVMVCEAFGFSPTVLSRKSKIPGRVWLEEFDPGHLAVNVVELVEQPSWTD